MNPINERSIYLIFLLTFLLTGPLTAQIITDRPDQTESSSTVDAGALQIESGWLIGFEGEGSVSTRQILAPSNLFRYGISNIVELRLLSQYETMKNDFKSIQGISDLEIGTKIQLLKKNNVNTEIAFISHLLLPTGSEEISSDVFGTINKIAVSHTLSGNLNLGYNFGYNYLGEGTGDLTYSLAFGIGINENAGVYIEPFGEVSNMEEFLLNCDTGFTYLVNPHFQLDFSFGTGITQRMNYISVGFSWLLKHDRIKTD